MMTDAVRRSLATRRLAAVGSRLQARRAIMTADFATTSMRQSGGSVAIGCKPTAHQTASPNALSNQPVDNLSLTPVCHDVSWSMRSWESARPLGMLMQGSDSQDRMDQAASLQANDEAWVNRLIVAAFFRSRTFTEMHAAKLTTPVGKLGDLTAAKGALTMHQAALTITVFGHRISNYRLTRSWQTAFRSMRPWKSVRPPRVLQRGSDSQNRMDQVESVTQELEETVTPPVGKFDDRLIFDLASTMRRAGLPTTVFGHHRGCRDNVLAGGSTYVRKVWRPSAGSEAVS